VGLPPRTADVAVSHVLAACLDAATAAEGGAVERAISAVARAAGAPVSAVLAELGTAEPAAADALRGVLALAGALDVARDHAADLAREIEVQDARNAALVASLERRHAVMVQLLDIQQAIAARAPLQEVMDAIAQGTAAGLAADLVGLRLIDDDDPSTATIRSSVGLDDDYEPRAPTGQGVGGAAIREDQLVIMEDYAADPRSMHSAVADGIVAAMAAPVHRDGAVAGALLFGTRDPQRQFTEHDRAALLSFAEVATLALNDDAARRATARAVADAEHRAGHDPLTGLPNRALVLERLDEALARARRTGQDVTVLFVDLDRFKRVNDSFGHSVGDEVLIRVAQRLTDGVREVDLVARLSGDEFVVIAEGLAEADALHLAGRLGEAVAAPLPLYGRETVITASVGVRRASGEAVAEQVLQDADVAMYRAKEAGRARTERFDGAMRTQILERLELERWLRHAAERGELRLHLQPIARAGDLALAGVEALVRWAHPERGVLTPDRFIGVAEEAGFIVAIDTWVLREACRQLARWRPARPDLRMNVNVSARQFTEPGFVDTVAAVLGETGLPGEALALEITESVLMADTAVTARTLRSLKGLGCRLVVDDFGTGYSSLAYLHRFPVDVVKIDRSFVASTGVDPEADVLVRAIVSLAGELGLEVVAEGVETIEQRDLLRYVGCDLLQGYLLGRPVDAATLPAEGFPVILAGQAAAAG
jgi:diguanylate cyclase (GGDEF)-like protein